VVGLSDPDVAEVVVLDAPEPAVRTLREVVRVVEEGVKGLFRGG
jgi:hypothetical protein